MNITALCVLTLLARREGLTEDRSLKYGVSGALMGLKPLTLIILYVLMQREAAAQRAAAGAVVLGGGPTPPD